MDSLPSNDRSTKKALGVSAGLHAALFAAVLFTSLLSPPPPPIPRTIFVRTVSLKPGPSVRAAPALKTQASGPQTSAPKEPGPPQGPPPGPAPGRDEKIIAEEEAEPSDEPAASKKVEEPSVEKTSAPAKKSTPAKTPVKASSAAKASPHSSGTSSPSKRPSPSTQSKPTQGKGKSVPKGSSSTQKSSGTKSSGTKSSSPQYDQGLLNDALRRLDRSKSAAVHGGGNGSGSGSGNGSGGVSQVGTVGALNVDSGVAVGEDRGDDGCDGYASASPEACYIGDLIRRLQLNVRLPEPGDVRVKLTLKKTGAITSVLVLSGSTASIKQAIEKKLKTVHFSPFGTSFSGESEHTFNLRLSNDLVWSCH